MPSTPCFRQQAHDAAVDAGGAGDDLHPRPGGAVRQRADLDVGRCVARLAAHLDDAVPHRPQRATFAGRERVGPLRMDLAHIVRGVDEAGEDDDHTVHRRIGRDAQRVGQVARAVGIARARRPHRAGEDHRLARRERDPENARQEVRRLLHRVGAVGDDEAGDVGSRRVMGDATGQEQPGRDVHVLAVDLGDLLGLDSDACWRHDARQQIADADLGRRIAQVLVGTLGQPGDRSTGAAARPRRDLLFASFHELDENTALDEYSAAAVVVVRQPDHQETSMQEMPKAHRPPAADSRPGPERHRAHGRTANPRRDRQRARLQIGQRRRRASAGAGPQGRDRADRRHVAWHPSSV